MLDINIPFSGFYESIHSQEIDRAIESMFDDRETGDMPKWGAELSWEVVEAGYIYESVCDLVYTNSSNAERLVDIHGYLLKRSSRSIKTMAQLSTYRRGLNLPFDATPLGGVTL